MRLFLILAAVLPAAVLMYIVYRSDRLEPEPPRLIFGLLLLGVISTGLAAGAERLGSLALRSVFSSETLPYRLLFYFCVVGPAEEGFKYAVLHWRTWQTPEFDCQYDGVVYAVSVALGFALWENIGYVLMYGFRTAVARALTAVPGHACLGVFMGAWYGAAKRYSLRGEETTARRMRVLCVALPALLHGCYDFAATMAENGTTFVFSLVVTGMFIGALRLVKKGVRSNRYF